MTDRHRPEMRHAYFIMCAYTHILACCTQYPITALAFAQTFPRGVVGAAQASMKRHVS